MARFIRQAAGLLSLRKRLSTTKTESTNETKACYDWLLSVVRFRRRRTHRAKRRLKGEAGARGAPAVLTGTLDHEIVSS